jgi:hypothetical protein
MLETMDTPFSAIYTQVVVTSNDLEMMTNYAFLQQLKMNENENK